jgi:predicted nucleic acid-binding protein
MAGSFLDTSALAKHYLLVKHFKDADRLIGAHGLAHRLRTLDALQLAVALDLHRRGMIDTLVSSDKQLLAAAVAEGIPVFDPENP